jgi:hypothetical protein
MSAYQAALNAPNNSIAFYSKKVAFAKHPFVLPAGSA